MNERRAVEAHVRDVRSRLRRVAGLDAAIRWALYGAMFAGAWLVAAKLFGWSRGPVWIAPALPAIAGAAAAARRLDLRQAAAFVDRALGLEERVATALETPSGPFGAAVASDAVRVLDRGRVAGVGRFRWPVESRFLVPALALVGALAVLPDTHASALQADAELRASVDPDVDRLARLRVDDPALAARVKEILTALRADDLKRLAEGAEQARKLAVEIRMRVAQGGADREGLRALADRLEAAGSGASAQLARKGIEVPEVAPIDLEARIAAAKSRGDLGSTGDRPEAWEVRPVPPGPTSAPVEVRQEIERRLAAKPLDPRYHEIVNRYYDRLNSSPRR